MASINLLGCSNGVGISRDISLLKNILESAGHDVFCNHTFKYTSIPRSYDLNIWLERFNPLAFDCAEKNVMIPNQEWFEKNWLQYLVGFDAILAKTRFAEKVFTQLNCKTHYIGFTSEDRYMPNISKEPIQWIHIAGKSIQKQTELVIKTWSDNPGFPHLIIVQDARFWKPRILKKNITFMLHRVQDDILKILQNTCSVHICPSETEGFGHYIMEAMGCASVVLTTNAAPMNELVSSEHGILVNYERTEPMNLSTKFLINQKTLEEEIIKLTLLDYGKLHDMGKCAREKFLENDAQFRKTFPEVIEKVLNEKQPQ